jgi:hypothetical protein
MAAMMRKTLFERYGFCPSSHFKRASPQTGPAPSSRSRRKVKQQTADDGEALEKLSALLRPKEHAQTRLPVGHPETGPREADQYQGRPTRLQADEQGQRSEELGSHQDACNDLRIG